MPTVLIVAASPNDQDRLRLAAEVNEIKNALRRSRNREHWEVFDNQAITVDELRRSILDHQPTILHFAGHGGPDGLCFEDGNGDSYIPAAEAVAKLIHLFRDKLKCVVLNACYSSPQAELIRKQIDYVVGMSRSILDEPARKFAVAFYDAVFAGVEIRTAFDVACTALDLDSLQNSDVPVFLTTQAQQKTTLAYSCHVPEVERLILQYINTPFVDRACLTTTGD